MKLIQQLAKIWQGAIKKLTAAAIFFYIPTVTVMTGSDRQQYSAWEGFLRSQKCQR